MSLPDEPSPAPPDHPPEAPALTGRLASLLRHEEPGAGFVRSLRDELRAEAGRLQALAAERRLTSRRRALWILAGLGGLAYLAAVVNVIGRLIGLTAMLASLRRRRPPRDSDSPTARS